MALLEKEVDDEPDERAGVRVSRRFEDLADGRDLDEALQDNSNTLEEMKADLVSLFVAEALHKYGRHKDVETLPIYGGQPYERQFRGLQRGVQIVGGTPGRVMDHMGC